MSEPLGLNRRAGERLVASGDQPMAPVRHVVVFRPKPSVSADLIAQITDAFHELKNTVPGIVSFEDGVNNSPEGKNHGFTHVFLVTFEDERARDAYLEHPDHHRFSQLLRQLNVLDDMFVVDYVPSWFANVY